MVLKILNISNDLKGSNWLKIEKAYGKCEKLLYAIAQMLSFMT